MQALVTNPRVTQKTNLSRNLEFDNKDDKTDITLILEEL